MAGTPGRLGGLWHLAISPVPAECQNLGNAEKLAAPELAHCGYPGLIAMLMVPCCIR